jgi:hypothetical protein
MPPNLHLVKHRRPYHSGIKNSGEAVDAFSNTPPNKSHYTEAPAFEDPIVVSTFRPWIGKTLPVIAVNPLITQPAMRGRETLISNAGDGAIVDMDDVVDRLDLLDAMAQVDVDPEAAGSAFAKIRERRRAYAMSLDDGLDPLFAEAAFGAALWGSVSAQTFLDLREIKKWAKAAGDVDINARESLVRAVAHMRANDDRTSMDVLNGMSKQLSNPQLQQGEALRVNALILRANLFMNRAMRRTGKARSDALDALRCILKEDLNRAIGDIQMTTPEIESLKESAARFYPFAADFLLQHQRPQSAREVMETARAMFPNAASVTSYFDVPGNVEGSGEREITNLHRLMSSRPGMLGRIGAAAAEVIRSSGFENNYEFWKQSLQGALAGGVAYAGAMIFSNATPTTSYSMMSLAIGAVLFVLTGKVQKAATAKEPREALATGRSNWKPNVAGAAGKGFLVAGGYAVMCGLLAHLSNIGIMRAEGLHEEIAQSGLLQGAANFWNNWAQHSYFAGSVDNALRLPLNDPIGKIFSGASWDKIPTALRTFSFDSPGAVAQSLGLGALYLYMAASMGYAFANMNPVVNKTINGLLKKSKWEYTNIAVKSLMFPGAFMATWGAMAASGVGVWAPVVVLTAYLVYYRNYVQGGGDPNIFRREQFKDLPLEKAMTAGAVQLLYIGTGAAIVKDLPDRAEVGNLQFLQNAIEVHAGIVPFLAVLGIFHAVMSGYSIKQTLKAKAAKAYTYDLPSNALKLILGWRSMWANTLGPLIKEFGLGAPVTNVYREAGDSPTQRHTFAKIVEDHRKTMDATSGRAANARGGLKLVEAPDEKLVVLREKMIQQASDLYARGIQAAMNGQAYGFQNEMLTKRSLVERLMMIADAYFMTDDRRLLIGPHLQPEWYRTIIFRGLTDPGTSIPTVDAFLQLLRVIAADRAPEKAYVRRNFIAATMRAMLDMHHGNRIYEFFNSKEGAPLIEQYQLQHVFQELKEKRRDGRREVPGFVSDMRVRLWQRRNILNFGVAPTDAFRETPADKFYGAVTVAGRRYRFSAPFTGRSAVENGSPFSSFLLSASQGDAPFQTTPDLTLYAGTLFKMLMSPVEKEKTTTEKHQAQILRPLLDLIGVNAAKLGDNRKDVRHNLLMTVLFASQGPNGQFVRQWIKDHKHLYHANGIYSPLKFDEKVDRLPHTLKDRGVDKLFAKHLWDSEVSADGMVVYPLDGEQGLFAFDGYRELWERDEGVMSAAGVPANSVPELYAAETPELTAQERKGMVDATGTWLARTIFIDGTFYADFSPNNLLWQRGAEGGIGRPSLRVFQDGTYGKLTASQRSILKSFLAAVLNNDASAAAETFATMCGGNVSLGEVQLKAAMSSSDRMTDKVHAVFAWASTERIDLDADYYHFIRAITSWETTMSQLGEQADFFAYAKPMLPKSPRVGGGRSQGGGAAPAAFGGGTPAMPVPTTPASSSAPDSTHAFSTLRFADSLAIAPSLRADDMLHPPVIVSPEAAGAMMDGGFVGASAVAAESAVIASASLATILPTI